MRLNFCHVLRLCHPTSTQQIALPFKATQFVLKTGPMEREARFQALKAESGSLFAWHGSSWGNWHSIVRNGLKNFSNTKYMTAGAAFGQGIYFADDISTSLGYSMGGAAPWSNSKFNHCSCLALCEVCLDRLCLRRCRLCLIYVTALCLCVLPDH
jgi:hypothetical protein